MENRVFTKSKVCQLEDRVKENSWNQRRERLPSAHFIWMPWWTVCLCSRLGADSWLGCSVAGMEESEYSDSFLSIKSSSLFCQQVQMQLNFLLQELGLSGNCQVLNKIYRNTWKYVAVLLQGVRILHFCFFRNCVESSSREMLFKSN